MLSAEDDSQVGQQKGRETDDDVHATGSRVLKVHIDVSRCAFTDGRVTVPCVTSCNPPVTTPHREVVMSRRHLSLLVLALLTFAVSACADVTAPEPSNDCPVTSGSGTKC